MTSPSQPTSPSVDDDIVERLRWQKRYAVGIVPVTMEEACKEIERLRAALSRSEAPVACIKLRPAEIQSGLDRVKWAEGLIRQLPETHDGRNSWLLNYAGEKHQQDKIAAPSPDTRVREALEAIQNLRKQMVNGSIIQVAVLNQELDVCEAALSTLPSPDTRVREAVRGLIEQWPHSIYTEFHLANWTAEDFAKHTEATVKTVRWLVHVEKEIHRIRALPQPGAVEPPPFGEGGLAGRMARHAKHFADHKGTIELTVTAKELRQIADGLAAPSPSLDPATVAIQLQEAAELAHVNCPECDGDAQPENCETCFPLYDKARVARRRALTGKDGGMKSVILGACLLIALYASVAGRSHQRTECVKPTAMPATWYGSCG